MNSYIIYALSTSEAPITHMSGTAGNEAIIAREQVVTPAGPAWVPSLSGNAFRHRAIREPGVMWLISEYGLAGKLRLEQLNFLLHGGNLSESTAHENTRRIAEMKRTWPLLRLLGGSLRNQILAGSMDVWRGVLACEENRAHLGAGIPVPFGRLLSAEIFVGGYQYTRGDAKKLGIQSEQPTALDSPSNLMIYSGQCVRRSAVFVHGFALKHVSDYELGALLWSLRLWQAQGGTIGGQASKGHGRLRCELILPDGVNQEAMCSFYCDYARSVKDDAVAWLEDAFK